jgi:hypothetical protein
MKVRVRVPPNLPSGTLIEAATCLVGCRFIV